LGDRCFVAASGTQGVTHRTCPEVGSWAGLGTENMTVIDTPGFEDIQERDADTVESLVDVLKNEVKSINAFVIVFNGQSPRFTYGLKSMMKLFQNIFGAGFWPNVIFAVTRWHYSKEDVSRRTETESKWTEDMNTEFNNLFPKIRTSIPAVFIDSLYNPDDPAQVTVFQSEMEKLSQFASSTEIFVCKDIEVALSEIQAMVKEKEMLQTQLQEERNRKLNSLFTTDNSICLWSEFCLDIPAFVGLIVGVLILGLLLGVCLGYFCVRRIPCGKNAQDDGMATM